MGQAGLSHHLTLARNMPKATAHVTFWAVASHMALQVASVASGVRLSLRAVSGDVAASAAHVAALLILLLASHGTLPGDVANLATDVALGVAVLTFVLGTLA